MKYIANGFEYTLNRKLPDRDVYEFIRPGGFIIWCSFYNLIVEGYLK